MAIAPPENRSEYGKMRGGHTRPVDSALGVTANRPANPYGDPGWTGIGRDAPEAVAAHAERAARKLGTVIPKEAGGSGTLAKASERRGQNASNAAGKGRGR